MTLKKVKAYVYFGVAVVAAALVWALSVFRRANKSADIKATHKIEGAEIRRLAAEAKEAAAKAQEAPTPEAEDEARAKAKALKDDILWRLDIWRPDIE